MRRSRIGTRLFHALSLVVIFVLVSQPIAVAARPLPASAPSPLDTLVSSGDLYLTNASLVSSYSAELAVALDRIQSTPLDQVPEKEITAARQTAWQTAEAAATALGTVDSLADTIELLADGASPALDLVQAAGQGLPEETRTYLQSVSGLTEEQVANVETDIHDTVSVRQSIAQNGLPAEYVDQLTQAGFTSAEIDAIANALGSRGLGNTNITTRLAQFRASRDELASARTRALFASIHLLGRQVASRQVQGVQPEEVSQEELQELATDEMRLLIHVAHIDQMWGQDPNLDVGEGDWWFIERYATRMSERLEALILKTHNRALVVDLLIAMQARTLALSARAGDAAYVKAELDGLAGLLEHQLETVGFVSSQQDTDNLVSTWLVRVSGKPALREQVWWPVSAGQRERIVQTNQTRLSHGKPMNALMLAGQVEEYNENNNRMTLIFAGGLPYGDALAADIAPAVFGILDQVNLENVGDWLYAILTGDTDNPLLLAASAGLSMLPILGLVPDLYSLMADPSTWVKALSLFGIVSGLVEGFTFVTGIAPISLGAAISKGASSVLRGLYHVGQFVASARPVLDGLNLRQAFELACQLVDVAARGIKVSVNTIEEAIAALQHIFQTGLKLWDDFCAFAARVKIEGLLRLGFNNGSWFVGNVIRRGTTLSDEGVVALGRIAEDLGNSAIHLSDDVKDGLADSVNILGEDRTLQIFLKCSTFAFDDQSSAKLALIVKYKVSSSVNLCDVSLSVYHKLDNTAAQSGVGTLATNYSSEIVDELLRKYATQSGQNLDDLRTVLIVANSSVKGLRPPASLQMLELLVKTNTLNADAIKYLPFNTLINDGSGNIKFYVRFNEFIENSTYLGTIQPEDGLTNLDHINHLAKQNASASVTSHFSQVLGEFRERRYIEYLQNHEYERVFDHLQVNDEWASYVSDPITQGKLRPNTKGIDSIAKKDGGFIIGEIKDKGLSGGNITEGVRSGKQLSWSDINGLLTKDQNTGEIVFDRAGFLSNLRDLEVWGYISASERLDIINSLNQGKLSINIFAGGRLDSFDNTLQAIGTRGIKYKIPDDGRIITIPVSLITDSP